MVNGAGNLELGVYYYNHHYRQWTRIDRNRVEIEERRRESEDRRRDEAPRGGKGRRGERAVYRNNPDCDSESPLRALPPTAAAHLLALAKNLHLPDCISFKWQPVLLNQLVT
jgi:hypothetical protein